MSFKRLARNLDFILLIMLIALEFVSLVFYLFIVLLSLEVTDKIYEDSVFINILSSSLNICQV